MKKAMSFALAFSAVATALQAMAASFNMLSCCPGEDCSTQARFVWHSDVSSSCEFYYSLSPETGGTKVTPKCDDPQCTFIDKNASGTEIWHSNFYYKYTVELSGLQPDTTYYYWVTIGGSRVGNVQKFKTGSMNTNFKFFWLSDVHADPDDAAKTNNVVTILNKAKESAGVSEFDFVLFSGDSVKWGNRYHHWQQWNQNLPFSNYMTALLPGNKEYYEGGNGYSGTDRVRHYKYYMEMRNDPGNGASGVPTSYWFLRNGVLFVMIDSIFSGGRDIDSTLRNKAVQAQTNWFDRVATEQRGKYQYIVAVQHYPYLKGSDICDYGNCEEWFPVFSKHQVDFALSGDSHQFTRSKPLISTFKDESLSNQTYDLNSSGVATTGTVYIVTSEIPKSPYSFTVNDGSGIIAKIASSGSSNGAGWFEVNTESITYHNISWGGAEVDKITVKAKRPPVAIGDGTTGGDATPHRRYRFKVDAPRSDTFCMQLSEIQLLDANGNRISSGYTLAYDSTTKDSYGDIFGSDETPECAVDGDTSTKWLDWRAGLNQSAATRSVVWLDFCFDSPTAVYGYRWYTANDAPDRTPVSWTFSASDDGGATWTVLDKVEGYNTTTDFKALAYSKRFVDLPLQPTTAGGTYYALSVGVNKYSRWPNGENDLGGCVADADDVLSACTNAVKGLWSAGNCYSLHDNDATLSAARSRLQSLADVAESGDTVLYYQSSHGGNSNSDPYRAHLCMTDADYYDDVFASDLLRFKTGVRIVVIIDACHSGGMFKGEAAPEWNFAASVQARMDEIKEEMRTKGVKASNAPSVGWITACDYDQLSYEVGGRGKFTKPFVVAWKSDSTDANGDGYNDFVEIFNIAAPQATSTSCVPQKSNDDLLASVAAWRLAGSDAFTWSGGYDGNRISSGKNWEGGVAPSAGSGAALTFPFSQDTTVVNDYDSLFARTISFPASNGRGVFTGGPVTVAESIVNSASATNRFESAVTFGGNIDVTGEMDFAGGVTGTVPAYHKTYRGNYNLTTTGSWTPPSGSRVPSGSTLSMPNGTFYCHINSLTIERDATVTAGAAKIDKPDTAYLLGENDGLFKVTGVFTSSGNVSGSKYHYLLHTGAENTSEGLIALDGIRIKGSPQVYANSYGGKYQVAIGNNGIKKDAGVSGYFLIRNDGKPQYIGSWCNGNDYKIAIVDSSGNYPVDTSEYVLYGSRTDRIYNINFDTTDCFNPGVRNTVRDMSPICGAAPAKVSVGIYGTGEFRFENTAVNATGLYSGGTVVSNSATVAILAGSCPGRGNLTLCDTATLSLPGAASGTATVFGTLSLAPGTTVSFGSIAAGTTPLSVGELVVGAGDRKPVVVSVNVSGLAAGTYPLIVSSSTTSGATDLFTLSVSGTTDKPLSLVKSGDSICLEVLSGVHGKWLGGNGGNRFSVAANWDDGEVPGAGDALDFSSVTSATAIEADVNATFGAVMMGSGVVTFTGSLTATSFSDTSKIAVGANSTVTLDGDLVFANATEYANDYVANAVAEGGAFVVTGDIVSSPTGKGYVVPTVNGGDGTIVAKGLVQNSRCSDNPSFRLVRDSAGTVRWVVGADGISGSKHYWLLNNSGCPTAIIKPDGSDFIVSAKIGNREKASLRFDTTGRDGNGHTISITGGIYREGKVYVEGSGTVACIYEQSDSTNPFIVSGTATLALSTIADIGTGAVTMQKGTTLSLGAAGYSFRGSFAVSGGSGKVSVKIGDGPVAAGKYTVFSATSISASGSDFALANAVPQDWTVAFSISGKSLVLEVMEPIPAVAADAAPEAVANAIDGVGFADAAVKDAINGSAAEYNAFRTWAASVKGAAGSAAEATAAGESAVIANANAAAAYLLGSERLFENAPKVEIGDVAVGESDAPGGGPGADSPVMTVAVTVKDGEVPVSCAAEKVAALFEATSDLGDWTGAAKLTPTVNVEVGEGAVMRFTVTPGDGTQPRAFLRIHK